MAADARRFALLVDEHVAVDFETRWYGAGRCRIVGVRLALRVTGQLAAYAVRGSEGARDDEQEGGEPDENGAGHQESLRPQEAFDGLRGLVHEVLGAIVVATGGSAGDAMVKVLVEQLHADALQRLADRRDLGEHVDAVRVVLDHSAEPTDLALDATQPREQLLLVVGVSREVSTQ